MMTLAQLRELFPAFRILGAGLFAVVCPSARRITLCQTLERALDVKGITCGWGCRKYDSPHIGYRLAAVQAAPVRRCRPLGWDDD
jgi:hypothetical protein